MPKTFSPHRIKTHLIYTPLEAAEALGAHRQTIIRWIKTAGLEAETSSKPWLICGADLNVFLGARQTQRKQRLAPQHLYCLGCKAPREPAGRMAEYRQETDATGMLVALCPECFNVMNKIIPRSLLDTIRARVEVTVQQACPRLMSPSEPRSEVHITAGATKRAKATCP